MYALKRASPRETLRISIPSSVISEGHGPMQQPLGTPLDIRQVARLIGCSVWTVRQTLIPQGLPYFRFATLGRLIFYEAQIIRWIVKKQRE
jgi:hypothetical protein